MTTDLQLVARQNQLTLNSVLQGMWAIVLSCHSGQKDVLFGITVSGRPADLNGVESIVGLFINALPLRVTIPPDAQLLPWLRQLQMKQANLQQYQYSSLVQIHEQSDVPNGVQLFQSLVGFGNVPMNNALENSEVGLEISDIEITQQNNYPLTFISAPAPELPLRIRYDCRYFSETMIDRLLKRLETLLQRVATQPGTSLGLLQEALSEFDGQQQVLNEKLYAEARRGMLDKIKRNSPKNINFVGD